jgi:hypothetical protein
LIRQKNSSTISKHSVKRKMQRSTILITSRFYF